jgi:glycosyltransferase involved in cell wall biosynthesis
MTRSRRALFWGFDLDEPSFRHRIRPLADELERRGWRCDLQRIPNRRGYVRRILVRREALCSADVLVMHRIKLSPAEAPVLRRLAGRVVYDIDDAVFLRRPRKIGQAPGRSWFRRHKFFNSCRIADLVTAGNSWLAEVAGRAARRVEVVPTSVVATAEARRDGAWDPRTVVWIGLPENLVYLEHVREALRRCAGGATPSRLRVVSSRFPDWPEFPVEAVQWSPQTEDRTIASAGVGIMPLTDDDWARGKCAFKLLQYMAQGLPCVASPVGANRDVVVDGETGFFAADTEEWQRALSALTGDVERSRTMGSAGLRRVRRLYDRPRVMAKTADLVERLVS